MTMSFSGIHACPEMPCLGAWRPLPCDDICAMLQVYMVPLDMKLGRTEMTNILRTGHSRIPVHEPGSPQDVIGLLLVKELVLLDPDDEVREGRTGLEGDILQIRQASQRWSANLC